MFILMNCTGPNNRSKVLNTFDSTLAVHLEAIRSSDLERLAPTVSDSVTLISPRGDKMVSKEAFMALHRNWFKQTNWKWTPQVLKSEAVDSMGYALVQYRYTEQDSTGSIQTDNTNYLVLIFKNSEAGWQLVHDQNTRIPVETGIAPKGEK